MSISEQISRIQTARNVIRAKLVALGLVTSTADIDACATAIDGIVDRGSVSATVQEGETYNIPKGYHNGSGTVSGVSGGGNYTLQSKKVAPTKAQQNVTPDSGYYGLSDVTVDPIPENYHDVSSVTAAAGDVLTKKMFVTADGKLTAGTMADNGAVDKTLDANAPSYTVPAGRHSGTGTVKIVPEEKTATPSKSAQDITPADGKVLTKVTVAAIPAKYIDTSDATATAANILAGKTAYVDGAKKTGTMTDNGAISGSIDGFEMLSFAVPAGYTSGGTISLTADIEPALAAI